MVIDERRDHSFRVPRPDLTVELGTPNACNDCHTMPDETPQWAADAVRKWYGDKRPDDPHWAPAIAAANRGEPDGEQLLVDAAPPTRRDAGHRQGHGAESHRTSTRRPTSSSCSRRHSKTTIRSCARPRSACCCPLQPLSQFLAHPRRSAHRSQTASCAWPPPAGSCPCRAARSTPRYHAALDKALDEYRASQQAQPRAGRTRTSISACSTANSAIRRKAVDELRTAIRLEPYLTGPRTELANMLAQQNGDAARNPQLRAEEADILDRDTKLLPDNADILYRLGLLRYLLGEYTAASQRARQGLRAGPCELRLPHDPRAAGRDVVRTRRRLAHFEAAVASLKKMAKLRPKDPRTEQILQRLSMRPRQAKGSRPAIVPPPRRRDGSACRAGTAGAANATRTHSAAHRNQAWSYAADKRLGSVRRWRRPSRLGKGFSMLASVLRPVRGFVQALLAHDASNQLAAGFALGMVLGLVPKGNLIARVAVRAVVLAAREHGHRPAGRVRLFLVRPRARSVCRQARRLRPLRPLVARPPTPRSSNCRSGPGSSSTTRSSSAR